MLHFDYEPHEYTRKGAAVGLIVLQTDEVMEPELRHWLSADAPLYHSRVPSGKDVTRESLMAMRDEIGPATHLLPAAAGIGVVAYGCTSGTTVIGEDNVAAAIRSVLPDVRVTNPLSAVKARLADLDCTRIGLLTPYEPEVSQALADHLGQNGFEIAAFGSFNEREEKRVTRIGPQSILNAVKQLGADDACDVVFASCTNLRTAAILDEAAVAIGKPVISSNSALAWHITHLLEDQAVSPK